MVGLLFLLSVFFVLGRCCSLSSCLPPFFLYILCSLLSVRVAKRGGVVNLLFCSFLYGLFNEV